MYVGYRALYVCCVSHLWIDTSMMYGVVHSFVYLFSSYTSRFSCMMMIRCYAMSFSMWRAYTLGVWLAQRYLNMLSLLSLLSSSLYFAQFFFCFLAFCSRIFRVSYLSLEFYYINTYFCTTIILLAKIHSSIPNLHGTNMRHTHTHATQPEHIRYYIFCKLNECLRVWWCECGYAVAANVRERACWAQP